MTRHRTVLFSSAGRRVELLRCFRADAAALGIELRVLASDIKPEWSAACQEADEHFRVPRCCAPEFIESLLLICQEHSVDLLIPTIDPELEILCHNESAFRAIGTDVVVSSPSVVSVARDKLRTSEFLGAHEIPAPRTALPDAVMTAPASWRWPVLLKPRHGSSSIGVRAIPSPSAFVACGSLDGDIVQELLEGQEYTVNVFFDRAGTLRCAVPHLRYEVRAGEVSKGLTRRHQQLAAISRSLGAVLEGARGPLCFQAMVDGRDRACVFEINARFGGGYPLAHRAGARFSQWLLEETVGLPPSCHDDWQDGIAMLRYDAAVFIVN